MTNRELRRIVKALKWSRREEAFEYGILEARTDIAKRMIRESFPPERIAQLTRLSQDDVRRIAAEMTTG